MGAKKVGPVAKQYLADEVIPEIKEIFSRRDNIPYQKFCVQCNYLYITNENGDTLGVFPGTPKAKTIKGKVDTINRSSESHPEDDNIKFTE